MKIINLFTVVTTVAAAAVMSAAAQEDYGGVAADWRPSFTPHGFNLQGMRVEKAEHGIFIINGKKVVK